MRAPLKYVQGKGALLEFYNYFKDLGKNWLFICSRSGNRTCHDPLEKGFGDSDTHAIMRCSAASPA